MEKQSFTYPLSWKSFTEADVGWVKSVFRALPDPFLFLKMAEVRISTSCCDENFYRDEFGEDAVRVDDMIEINGAYTITRVIRTETTETLVSAHHRETFKYVVYEPCLTPGSHWEPEEWDISEVGVFDSLADAVRAIFLRECEGTFNLAAEAAFAADIAKAKQEEVFDDIPY